ncbi:MAG TPA: FUSC family protein [Brevibacterium sp.]|nr:FUSC family protein [Brevibacterium sp.]
MIAPAIAGVLGILSTAFWPELSHPYWAMVAAVAPITPPHRTARVQRRLHRIVGTLGGLVVTAFILSFPAQPWQLVVWVILLQFLAEVFVGRNYAFALLFITPLALAMTQIAHPQAVGQLVTSRAVETVIGAAMGIVVVVVGFRHTKE